MTRFAKNISETVRLNYTDKNNLLIIQKNVDGSTSTVILNHHESRGIADAIKELPFYQMPSDWKAI